MSVHARLLMEGKDEQKPTMEEDWPEWKESFLDTQPMSAFPGE